MIPLSALQITLALEAAAPMKLKGTKIDTHRMDKNGKLVRIDKAPTNIKQARRRKAGKVTGAKPAR